MNPSPHIKPSVEGTTLSFKVEFATTRHGRKELRLGTTPRTEPSAPATAGALPRATRLMALAIKMDHLVRCGAVKDHAELARLGHVTRARVSQIMNLLNLAPDIMEAVLMLPRVTAGRSRICEYHLREVLKHSRWSKQREVWAQCRSTTLTERA